MAKKAQFFSHDMNARHDPKMTAMRGVYGAKGYGWFWLLVEMMAESDGYMLDMQNKYSFNAYALQLQCTTEEVAKFVHDCIHEFDLFESSETHFWSKSLRRRMTFRDEISEKRSQAANVRWKKSNSDANAQQVYANAMQTDANKTKQNKTNKYSPEFDEFWDVYPRKIEKATAWKVWQRRLKEGVDPKELIACAENYAAFCDTKKTEPQFIKHASTFLNDERYKDYSSPPARAVSTSNIPMWYERMREEEERPNEPPVINL